MLCAGHEDGSPDTCGGDSGGPLARKVDGRWRLVGVTSYGVPGCGSVGTYGVYAWVGSPVLRNWLREQVGY
jgi:secreted trypsin-like serine protease